MKLMHKFGFLIFEYLLVLLSLIIISGIMLHYCYLFDGTTAYAEASKLLCTCYRLHEQAQAQGKCLALSIDVARQNYTYEHMRYVLPKSVYFGAPKTVMGPPSQPLYYINKPTTFKQNRIDFMQDGNVTSGSIYIMDTKQHCYAITSDVSDRAQFRLYRYNVGKWQLLL